MHFSDFPTLRMLPSGDQWEMVTPLVFHHKKQITVPAGFVTDLASIPRLFQNLIPVNGSHSPAAIVHDYLYQVQDRTRSEADSVFLDAMAVLGVPWLRRRAMYLAVRVGGWAAWNDRQNKKLEEA